MKSLIVLLMMLAIATSCSEENFQEKEQENPINLDLQEKRVLKEKAHLSNGIYLPAGTTWEYTDESKSSITFNLPEEFSFFVKDDETGKYKIAPPIGGGGYSCTCSGSNSCTVFYNKDVGYGCLHSSCTGSCTGTAARTADGNIILGVLVSTNNTLDAVNDYPKASLSAEGKKAFFNLPQVQKEIKRTYDFVYKNIKKPDFASLDLKEDVGKGEYNLLKASLYGFNIAIVIPDDPSLYEFFPQLEQKTIEPPTACSCSGGGSGCDFEKDCILGYCAYYCNGCTTCTMN